MDLKELLKGKEFNIEKLRNLINTNAVACASETDESVAFQSKTVNSDGMKAITWDGNTEGLEKIGDFGVPMYRVSDALEIAPTDLLDGVVALHSTDEEVSAKIIAVYSDIGTYILDGIDPDDESTFPDAYVEVEMIKGTFAFVMNNEIPCILNVAEDESEFGCSAGLYFLNIENYYISLFAYKETIIKDYLIKSNTISNIANSIRDKLGTSAKMLLEDMPNAIKSIATVGDSITITWDGQPTETVFDSRYYKVSDLYFNGTQLINATVTLTNGTEEVTGKYTDERWNKLGLKTGDKGVAWGLELGLFSTDGTNTDLGASKGTYIGVLASGDYSGYWVSSITYPVTPDVLLQEKTITANGTYSADEGYDGISKVTVNVEYTAGDTGLWSVHDMDTVTIYQCDNPVVHGNVLEVK